MVSQNTEEPILAVPEQNKTAEPLKVSTLAQPPAPTTTQAAYQQQYQRYMSLYGNNVFSYGFDGSSPTGAANGAPGSPLQAPPMGGNEENQKSRANSFSAGDRTLFKSSSLGSPLGMASSSSRGPRASCPGSPMTGGMAYLSLGIGGRDSMAVGGRESMVGRRESMGAGRESIGRRESGSHHRESDNQREGGSNQREYRAASAPTSAGFPDPFSVNPFSALAQGELDEEELEMVASNLMAQQQGSNYQMHTSGEAGAMQGSPTDKGYDGELRSPTWKPTPPPSSPQFYSTPLQRVVYLGNIAENATVVDVCNTIRTTGPLFRIRMLPEKRCAFLTFIDPAAAQFLFQFGLTLGIVIKGQRCKVGWGREVYLPKQCVQPIQKGATRNIYLGGIDLMAHTEERLREDFGRFGELEQIHILAEKNTAFVNFCSLLDAIKAKEQMEADPTYFGLKVQYSKDRVVGIPRVRPVNTGY